MSESTLALAFDDLRQEIGQFLGYGRTIAAWAAAQSALIEALLHSGVRRFYWPPPLPGQAIAHEWSFIKPTTTLTVNAPYSTGTVAVTNGSAIVTGTGTVFPSWAASGVIKVAGGVPYTIATRDSNTQVTLDVVYAGTTASLQKYELSQEDYDLPDSFGHIEGSLTYQPNLRWPPIQIVGEGHLVQMRQAYDGSTGTVRYAAIRPKSVPASATVGQRFQVLFFPGPDASYVLNYRYAILPDKLTSSNAMPYGGAALVEALLEACLSVAEERLNDTRGVHYQAFMERLSAAIAFDSRNRPDTLGYAYDRSDDYQDSRYPVSQYGITYNSIQY